MVAYLSHSTILQIDGFMMLAQGMREVSSRCRSKACKQRTGGWKEKFALFQLLATLRGGRRGERVTDICPKANSPHLTSRG